MTLQSFQAKIPRTPWLFGLLLLPHVINHVLVLLLLLEVLLLQGVYNDCLCTRVFSLLLSLLPEPKLVLEGLPLECHLPLRLREFFRLLLFHLLEGATVIPELVLLTLTRIRCHRLEKARRTAAWTHRHPR